MKTKMRYMAIYGYPCQFSSRDYSQCRVNYWIHHVVKEGGGRLDGGGGESEGMPPESLNFSDAT